MSTKSYIEAYQKLQEITQLYCIICGSFGLKLQNFQLSHDPEDIDVLISPEAIDILTEAGYPIRSGNYNGSFKTIINDIEIDLICKNCEDLSREITVEISTSKGSILVAHYESILHGKLFCCINNKNNQHQIDELIYILKNNKQRF